MKHHWWWQYLHSIGDAVVHKVGVSSCVDGGNNDVLHFGLFVPQLDVPDGVVPMNPAAFSFELS